MRPFRSTFKTRTIAAGLTSSSSAMLSSRLDSPSAQRNKEVIWNVLKTKVLCPEGVFRTSQLQVLEIAAGSGVHSHYFCEQLLLMARNDDSSSSQAFSQSVVWFPSDPSDESRRSIEAYRDDAVSGILQLPLELTLDETGIMQDDMPIEDGSVDVIVCINMIHISPWGATVGLMKAAQRLLKPGTGILYCYGPFREGGTAVESNLYVFICGSVYECSRVYLDELHDLTHDSHARNVVTSLAHTRTFEVWLKSLDSSYGLRNLEDVVDLAEANLLEFKERMEMPANNLSVLFRRKDSSVTPMTTNH